MESNGLSVQEKKRKIDFQDGGHLGFPIGTILAIWDLQVTPVPPSKFGVKWPFSSGIEAKNIFSRWLPWRPSWISDQSRQSVGPGSSRPKKFKTQPSAGKVTATVFWDAQGVIMLDFLAKKSTITGVYYANLLD